MTKTSNSQWILKIFFLLFENPNREFFASRAHFNQAAKGSVKFWLNEKHGITCLTVEEIFKLCHLQNSDSWSFIALIVVISIC